MQKERQILLGKFITKGSVQILPEFTGCNLTEDTSISILNLKQTKVKPTLDVRFEGLSECFKQNQFIGICPKFHAPNTKH